MNNISIIIPAFNAGSCIATTLQKIKEVFEDSAEIIVVINESTYDTANIIKNIANKDSLIRVLHFKKRLGKGKAILEGFKIARGNILGFIDVDCPFDLYAIKKELEGLNLEEYECVICSKWIGRSFREVNQRFFRKILSRAFNFIIKNLLNMNFTDTQAGAKFIKKEAFAKIGYDFICSGFDFDVELLEKLLMKRCRIKEVYIPHYNNTRSTVCIIRDIFPIIFNIYRLKKRYLKK